MYKACVLHNSSTGGLCNSTCFALFCPCPYFSLQYSNNLCYQCLALPQGLIGFIFLSLSVNSCLLTQEVAQLWVQSLQQDAELKELLLHGLLRLFKVLVLQREQETKDV